MITVSSTNGTTVDFDITLTTTGTSPLGTIGSPVGFLGNLWSFQYSFFGTVTNRYVAINPALPAIDYGDGSTLDNTVLPMVAPGPPRVYQGSFMHTYPSQGSYTATAGVFRFIGPAATVTPPAPGNGNLVTLGTATPIQFYRYLLPTFPTPTYLSGTFGTPYVIGMTNSATVQAFADIPAVQPIGLFLLAGLLAAGGLFLLRR
jgi:hypothetical protein